MRTPHSNTPGTDKNLASLLTDTANVFGHIQMQRNLGWVSAGPSTTELHSQVRQSVEGGDVFIHS